jgi:four helix bundle protein
VRCAPVPRHERYGLATDLRKTARSIPYNIAEGHRRTSTLEYIRFLDIACGSAAELEAQFLLGRALGCTDEKLSIRLLSGLAEVERMLAALMRKLREKAA